MIIVLAGPIEHWWSENWRSPEHIAYMEWREYVHTRLVEAGHLVFRPDRAFKGAWSEKAQVVNDAAIEICDVLIWLTPPGIPAHGTDAEVKRAQALAKTTLHAPPNNAWQIDHLTIPLNDPYGNVHRKAYT